MKKWIPVLALLVTACSGSSSSTDSTEADQKNDGTEPAPKPNAGSSSSSSSSTGGSAAPSGACADVGGAWKGTVDGGANLLPSDTDFSRKVDGTAAIQFDKGADATSFSAAKGSKFDVTIDAGALLGKIPTSQELTGTVKCGKFDATSSATVGGQKYSGTASCTFDATGCKGTFEVHQDDNGQPVAKGTFTLTR